MSDFTKRAPVFTTEEAAVFAAKLHKDGKKIVFTNGCFDLIHPGHLEILEKSRKLGDCLFVGLNTDDSVTELKGKSRPIQPLSTRAAVLASLRFVDCIVPFSKKTPLELIGRILPDVLVKGGDYTPEQVVGADIVIRNGGKVVIVPLLRGYSTTLTVEKIT